MTRMKMMSKRAGWMLLCALAWALPGDAFLGVGDIAIVFDPNNYATALATQAHTLKSTINEGLMIANQAKALEYQAVSLFNEATNLKANPLQLLGRIQGLWDGYNVVMDNAEGIGFGLQQAQQRFEHNYPALATPAVQDITARTKTMLESIRGSTTVAIKTQSVYDRLCEQLTSAKQALTAAQASTGALQIAQAQAQIQALGSEQLATIAQIEAATGRVQTEWIAMQAKERTDAEAHHEDWMAGYGAAGYKAIGQSRGVELR